MAMTPGCFLVLLVGHLAARHENKWMMISFFLGCLCALIYFIYKVRHFLFARETERLTLTIGYSCTVYSAYEHCPNT
jgi:hypothetical protein